MKQRNKDRQKWRNKERIREIKLLKKIKRGKEKRGETKEDHLFCEKRKKKKDSKKEINEKK